MLYLRKKTYHYHNYRPYAPCMEDVPAFTINLAHMKVQIPFMGHLGTATDTVNRDITTPLKINMEHNHGGLEDHVSFFIGSMFIF